MGQSSANAANQAMAREQMAFQERMRSTQYQTAVKDMIATSLNPMLAYQNGGAGKLSGVTASFQNALGAGVSSALETRQAFSVLQKIKQEIEESKSNIETSGRQVVLNETKVALDNAIAKKS